jgi:hypothetical protein
MTVHGLATSASPSCHVPGADCQTHSQPWLHLLHDAPNYRPIGVLQSKYKGQQCPATSLGPGQFEFVFNLQMKLSLELQFSAQTQASSCSGVLPCEEGTVSINRCFIHPNSCFLTCVDGSYARGSTLEAHLLPAASSVHAMTLTRTVGVQSALWGEHSCPILWMRVQNSKESTWLSQGQRGICGKAEQDSQSCSQACSQIKLSPMDPW